MPSLAVDVAPAPVDWADKARFIYFAGIVKEFARRKGLKIRWGGDWQGDGKLKDNKFSDLVHFELLEVS
jgi:peptidoglycan L-alanyl-D-glutamate endopeptidase CwlK